MISTQWEGLLPAYVAARNRLPLNTVKQVLDLLLAPTFLNHYVAEGGLYCGLRGTMDNHWAEDGGPRFLYPSPNWFAGMQPEAFNAQYQALIGAQRQNAMQ